MIKKVYISGAISGSEGFYALQKIRFEQAALTFKAQGFEVVNPFELDHSKNSVWADFMRTDIKAMMDCTHVYMVSGWEKSKGAKIEHDLAFGLGMSIFYHPCLE